MEGYVSGIYEHLIKSCAAVRVGRAYLERTGFWNDRKFMVVSAANVFLSQRDFPRMALIQSCLSPYPDVPSYAGGMMVITAPGMYQLRHWFSMRDDTFLKRESGRIHEDPCMVVDQGQEAAEWLSRFLKTPCKLVRVIDNGRTHRSSTTREEIPVYAQDGYPVNIIGQPSLDDLNSRMATPISIDRFRPNIVIAGVLPYAEDGWKRIRIGKVEIRVIKPNQRCPVTTINQDTGEQPENPWDAEPLRTLLTYRSVEGGGVVFGVNCVPENEGWINLGDSVGIFS